MKKIYDGFIVLNFEIFDFLYIPIFITLIILINMILKLKNYLPIQTNNNLFKLCINFSTYSKHPVKLKLQLPMFIL